MKRKMIAALSAITIAVILATVAATVFYTIQKPVTQITINVNFYAVDVYTNDACTAVATAITFPHGDLMEGSGPWNLETAVNAYWIGLTPTARGGIGTHTVQVSWTSSNVPTGWTLTLEWYDSSASSWNDWPQGAPLSYTSAIWKHEVIFYLVIPASATAGAYDFNVILNGADA